ncbi:MAG: exo-alpha-sialidase [Anaerolineales bacterium]|nr:exo-alpha-sialidase [Anaerolineales bacterium]
MVKIWRKTYKHIRWSIIGFLILALFVFQAAAQTDDEKNRWDVPVNLSHSGAALDPVFVVDQSGLFHVFWQDEFAGYVYRTGDGETWSDAQIVRVPFTDDPYTVPGMDTFGGFWKPYLVTDNEGLMHAFWLDDEESVLYYSRALIENVTGGSGSWTAPVRLAESVAQLDITADEIGKLHLAYIRTAETEEFPAGVYYRQSADGGSSWSEPTLLFASSYYRTATPEASHIRIETAGESKIFIAWDNRALDTVLTMRSPDNGETWTEPFVVDRREPEDPAEAAGPSNIDILVVDEDEVHLSWWSGDNEDALTCLLNHQWSSNGGAAWSEAEVVFEDSHDCPVDSHFVLGENGLLLLMTLIRAEGYMQAWDGEVWTEPNPQLFLGKFQDPETYRDVFFGCNQPTVTDDNTLFVVGCGDGNDRDIWILQRPIGEAVDWFGLLAASPVWTTPVALVNSSVYLQPAEVIPGTDGRLHAFWSQSNDIVAASRIEQASTEVGSDIYYSRLNNNQWASPRPIIKSPIGKADQLVATTGRNDSLLLVWSSGKGGGLYFSRAKAENASSATEWTEPLLLPAPQTTGSWPDMLVNEKGVLYVAYTIPLNEGRGIYLTRSLDNGDSWSDPVLVFDGEANGWEVVGRPRIAQTLGDTLHLTWTQDVPTSSSTLSMVYARSTDDGRSWSEPEVVTEETVVWSGIVGVGDRTVHRAWLGLSDSRTLLWHQVSFDNGLTWGDMNRVSDPSTESGPAALMLDIYRTPHLLQLAETNETDLLLQEWIWNGERWTSGEALDLGLTAVGADAITAVQVPDGALGIIYSTLLMDTETAALEDYLIYTSRSLADPEFEPTPLPTLTPTPLPTATLTPTPAPSPTPTVAIPQFGSEQPGFALGPISANSSSGGIILGVLPAVLIVGLVFAVGFWLVRRK